MKCAKCNGDVQDGMQYCPHCGTKIVKCPYCGQLIYPSSQFCHHCGRTLNDDQNYYNENTQKRESSIGGYYKPLDQDDHYNHQSYDYNNSDYYNTYDDPNYANYEKPKKKINILLIVGAVIVLVALSGLSYWYLYYGSSSSSNNVGEYYEDDSNTTTVANLTISGTTSYASQIGNNIQGGYVYQTDDKIYMQNNNGYLVSMDYDLSNQTVLLEDDVSYINVTDDKIYYCDSNYILHSMDLDGSNDTTYFDDEDVYYVNVIDNMIYYQLDSDSESIYVYDIEAKTSKQITDHQSYNINVVDDVIYFTGSDGIYSVSSSGQGEEKLISGEVDNLIYSNGKLYYCIDAVIYSYDVSTKETTTITEGCLFNMTDEYLFYYTSSYVLYRYDISTGQSTSIYTGYISDASICGDKLVLTTYSSSGYEKVLLTFDGTQQQQIFTELTTDSGDYV
ncbi:MAG: DUF5050 domain-containing protein [Erysipelotrichaceae bacterium]|nr:DUF5050 domain-containing protein [Erysipelotrichaceae bacterium]